MVPHDAEIRRRSRIRETQMTPSRSTRHLLTSAVACGFVLWASPANAAAYYSASDPLTAWEDGRAQAQGYGYMTVHEYTYLRNHTYTRDPRPGGDSAFHVTDYSLEQYAQSYGWKWSSWRGEDQSSRTDSGYWEDQYDYYRYTDQEANRGRIRAKVCEDQGWSSDPCSAHTYQTFNL
jgi:hypothetical protein